MEWGDYDNRTPLHLAAANDHFEAVNFLLSIGVYVNSHDRWGSTPLNDAVSQRVKDVLVRNGGSFGVF